MKTRISNEQGTSRLILQQESTWCQDSLTEVTFLNMFIIVFNVCEYLMK